MAVAVETLPSADANACDRSAACNVCRYSTVGSAGHGPSLADPGVRVTLPPRSRPSGYGASQLSPGGGDTDSRRDPMRKFTVIGVLIATTALLATCVHDRRAGPEHLEGQARLDQGRQQRGLGRGRPDEPYAIQLGFRSKVGVPARRRSASPRSARPRSTPSTSSTRTPAASTTGETKVLGNACGHHVPAGPEPRHR